MACIVGVKLVAGQTTTSSCLLFKDNKKCYKRKTPQSDSCITYKIIFDFIT